MGKAPTGNLVIVDGKASLDLGLGTNVGDDINVWFMIQPVWKGVV